MANHYHPDDESEEPDADFSASDGDHFGLFDDVADGSDDDRPTGEMDLDALREVLAGRGEEQDDGNVGFVPPRRRRRRRRSRALTAVLVLVVVALIAAGVVVGVSWWRQSTATPTDFAGTGEHTVVIRVHSGQGLYDVGQTLVDAGVVADVATFVAVASDDGRLAALQPGFYVVHEHSASHIIVDELADDANRVGRLRITPGQTLADITVVATSGEKSTRQGIVSAIADACVPTNGAAECFTVEDLWQQVTTAAVSDLGVVGWAVGDVEDAPDAERRLEGLILPGDYDIAPGSTAFEALRAVVSASAARWNTTDIVHAATKQRMTPYQLAIVASLTQAEGNTGDMRKVARVVYNRLDIGKKLEFDSTVNYGLNRAAIATTNAERTDASNAYSTYAHLGLTPTPIGAPGPTGLDAAEDPATGDWIYFVAIDLDGNTCFSVTFAEHEACIEIARDNGVFG